MLLFGLQISTAQNKDKVKGSKNVIFQPRAITSLINLEVEDNFTVNFIKSNKSAIEIEADDNLHEFIIMETFGDKVRIFSTKRIASYKTLNINVKYTDSLKTITARHKATINAFSELSLENLTINNLDYSKSFLNVKAIQFHISIGDKSNVEMNVKADETFITMKGDADLKALVSGKNLTLSMHDDTEATIEGDTSELSIQLTGKSSLMAKNIVSKETKLNVKNSSKSSVFASGILDLESFNDAEVHLYGNPKINIIEFKDKSSLHKENK